MVQSLKVILWGIESVGIANLSPHQLKDMVEKYFNL